MLWKLHIPDFKLIWGDYEFNGIAPGSFGAIILFFQVLRALQRSRNPAEK